jgi:hypothetical protein
MSEAADLRGDETIAEMLGGLTLPAGIQAEVLEVRTAATGTTVTRIAVWGPAERVCPGCEPVYSDRDPIRGCPVMLDPSMGDVQARDQQHGCGTWWGPDWVTIDPSEAEALDELRDRVVAAADKLMEDVRTTEAEADARARAALRRTLAEALAELDAGAEPDDVATGSEMDPGVYRDGDEWIAWDYAEAWDNDGTEFVEVRESELPSTSREVGA